MSTYASQAPLSSPNMRTVNVQIRSPSAAVRSPKSPVRRQSTLQLRVVPLRADANIFDQHGQLKEKADMEHPDEDEELKKLKEMEKEDRKLENERRLKRHSRPLDKPLETGIRPIDVSSALSEIVGTAASSPQAKDRIKNVLQRTLQQSHKIEQREEILRRHNRNASVTEALDELNEQELQQQEQLEQQQAAQPAELTSAASEEEPSHDRPKLTAFDSTVSNYSDQFSDSDHEEGELNEDGTPKLKRARTLRPTASANINDDEFEKVNYCPRCPSWSDWSINAIGKRRNALYNLFEHPQSSVTAHVLAIIIQLVIILSIVSLVLETEPGLQSDSDQNVFNSIELFCVVFFSVEYILRLLVTKLPVWRFVFQLTNMLDLISILPYYLFLFVDNHNDGQSLFRVFRVVRIFRIFRLSRYVTWFKILNAAITESGVPLIMMLFVLLIGAVFFASIMYFLERGTWSDTQQLYLMDGDVSPFQSIPACMYFVFISMCTVGYGDMIPSTGGGKVVAGLICICGVLVLSIPVSVISQNFAYEFEESDRQKAKLRLKMGNRYGRTQNEALQPATILNAHKLTTRQIRLLEHHNAELLHREIDRILTRSNGWIGDLDGILKTETQKMRLRVRSMITKQFNGEILETES